MAELILSVLDAPAVIKVSVASEKFNKVTKERSKRGDGFLRNTYLKEGWQRGYHQDISDPVFCRYNTNTIPIFGQVLPYILANGT